MKVKAKNLLPGDVTLFNGEPATVADEPTPLVEVSWKEGGMSSHDPNEVIEILRIKKPEEVVAVTDGS